MKNLKLKLTYNTVLVIILVALIVLFGFIIPGGRFFDPKILLNTVTDVAYLGIMALPMTFIIITSGIDLSVGFMMTASAMVFSKTLELTSNISISIIIGLLSGLLFGLLNGVIIGNTKIPPLIATLATMSIFQGITWFIGGSHSFSSDNVLVKIGNNKIAGIIPNQLIILLVIFIIFDIVQRKTTLGRNVHSIGFNENCVEYSGISTKKIKIIIYGLCGLMCAFAGFMFMGRSFEINSTTALNMNLEVITLVVLGGTSTSGGVGSIRGTVVATLIIGVLKKGLALYGLSGDVYNFILGAVLVVSLIVFAQIERKKKINSRKLAESALKSSMA